MFLVLFFPWLRLIQILSHDTIPSIDAETLASKDVRRLLLEYFALCWSKLVLFTSVLKLMSSSQWQLDELTITCSAGQVGGHRTKAKEASFATEICSTPQGKQTVRYHLHLVCASRCVNHFIIPCSRIHDPSYTNSSVQIHERPI